MVVISSSADESIMCCTISNVNITAFSRHFQCINESQGVDPINFGKPYL